MALLAELLATPYLAQALCVAVLVLFVSSFWQDLTDEIPYSRIPLVGKRWWDLSNKKAKARFTEAARALIAEGFAKGTSVFQVMATTRPLIVLHPKYVDEIKSHPHLDFELATKKNFFEDRIAGFEAFHPAGASRVILDTVRIKLTQALGSLTIPLSIESAATLKGTFPPSNGTVSSLPTNTTYHNVHADWFHLTEWTTYNFSQKVPYMIARLSTLVFMGESVCRDPAWLDVSVNYTIDAFLAARALRMWPSVLRPLVHWFMPSCQKLRQHFAVARAIVAREIENRTLAKQVQLGSGGAPRRADALDWLDELSTAYGSVSDQPREQVGLALAAIHTTSNLLTNVVYDLAAYPEYVEPLREEIKAVLIEDGSLKKTSLLKLKLLDSVIKESQRINPVSIVSMNRVALSPIPLSDGTLIPAGATIAVSAHINEDDTVYPNASSYDGFRFYKKRQEPGHEHRHQLVTTTSDNFSFGHGRHACPGRFFAANETKILLVHLLLNPSDTIYTSHGIIQASAYSGIAQ
ncbi:Fumitremorgin C monooxygenase [Penicillium subrubescens]|uniref:Fumitremorgin C monooxygenase n=1 Tax=Penicillium subrubescens TaxID=1316194 RepID=A0A1Q5UH36_9EURO|nr:Fumitremorgin C monooxygenase [Penicillium subrubescens]